MPQYLVERINASLAVEAARRAAQPPGASVTPLLTTTRRRRSRLVLAIAGAAAAVTVVAVVADNLFTADQPTVTSGSAVMASTSGTDSAGVEGTPKAAKAPAAAGPTTGGSLVQIGQSGTRYTGAEFVAQAEALRRNALQTTADPSTVGPAGTTSGLTQCLSAIGAAGARVIRADVAFYQGRPAVIIITTTNGVPMAYVVTPQCSRTEAAVLRPATALP